MPQPLRVRAPINAIGTAGTVSISNSAWTKIPASGNLSGRTGIVIKNPATNNAKMVGILSSSASSPSEATTVRPFEFSQTTDFTLIPVSDKVYVYLMSLHSGAAERGNNTGLVF